MSPRSLDFSSMLYNYEARKVARYEGSDLIVSTCAVTDSDYDYETAISHPLFDHGHFIVVENCRTKEQAKASHEKWVQIMTHEPLPKELSDISKSGFALLRGRVTYKIQKEEKKS